MRKYWVLQRSSIFVVERRMVVGQHSDSWKRYLSMSNNTFERKINGCYLNNIRCKEKYLNTRLGLTLLEQEAWMAQVHRVDQVWRVYYYSCIPTNFLVDHFTIWRAAERFFVEFFSFLFNNTCRCYICVCISLPYSLPFNCCCVCD